MLIWVVLDGATVSKRMKPSLKFKKLSQLLKRGKHQEHKILRRAKSSSRSNSRNKLKIRKLINLLRSQRDK